MSLWARKIAVNRGDSFAVKLRFMPTRQANTSSTWVVVKRLYEQAVELPRAEREAFLLAAETDDSVRAEVRSLLAHDPDQTGHPHVGFLNDPAAIRVLGAPDRTGEHLGAWQIVRSLGSGGMGDVFEARRADGSYEGRAAVKLLKHGMTSPAVLQRFAHERQALARLHHPHIATLLDAGLSGDGLPYFVMEFVDGVPIDEAVRGMNLAQRLGLFLQLTQAVSHAHQNLLVHGDLKPGNVLVTNNFQVKLLDFGIVMALDPTDATGPGGANMAGDRVLPFTPNYASPEQVRGEPVGTATDIYSLGVLLYQLLTGVRPTGRDATTPAQAARSVLDETPTRPSSLPDGISSDPHWLKHRKHLSGDLDHILLKTLEKSVQHRYTSVDALAADVRAYLGGHPVSAREPSLRYLMGKFLARHRWGVTALGSALLAVSVTTGMALWQARLAEHARQAAQQHLDAVHSLARTMIFDVNDALTRGLTPGREALVKAVADYLAQRAQRTDLTLAESMDLVDALRRMADVEGNVGVDNMGRQDSALARYAQALTVLERVAAAGRDHPAWLFRGASVRRSQAMLLLHRGEVKAALESMERGSAMVEHALQLNAGDMKARSLACKLQVLRVDLLYSASELPSLGRLADAIEAARKASACAQALLAAEPDRVGNVLVLSSAVARFARLSLMAGQLEEGVAAARRNAQIVADLLARESQDQEVGRFSTAARSLLGYALLHAGQVGEGLATLSAGVDAARSLMRGDPQNQRVRRDFVAVASTLGESLNVQGRGSQARETCTEAQNVLRGGARERTLDREEKLYLSLVDRCIAGAWLLQRKPSEALRVIDPGLQRIASGKPSSDPGDRRDRLQGLGLGHMLKARALQQLGRFSDALEQGRVAVARMEEILQQDSANSETQSDVAYVQTQASLLGAHAVLRPDSEQCRWAHAAHAIFSALAERSRLNLEYGVDKKQAQAQVRRCEALPG